jgi:hypothetical protein
VSEREHDTAVPEARSKIKLVRNAKGDTQIEVSIVDGTTTEEARPHP